MAELLNTLLDRGVNLIDTAASYSGSEAAIGEAIGHRRDDYLLVSKCGQAFEDIEGAAWSAAAIEQTVERTLRRLNTNHIDVVLLHSCDLATLKKGEALGALVKARDAGPLPARSTRRAKALWRPALCKMTWVAASPRTRERRRILGLYQEARGHDAAFDAGARQDAAQRRRCQGGFDNERQNL